MTLTTHKRKSHSSGLSRHNNNNTNHKKNKHTTPPFENSTDEATIDLAVSDDVQGTTDIIINPSLYNPNLSIEEEVHRLTIGTSQKFVPHPSPNAVIQYWMHFLD